jgi:hypothetical protein
MFSGCGFNALASNFFDLDPFNCGNDSACNRQELQKITKTGHRPLSYNSARERMFQFIDVRELSEKRVVFSVYSTHIFTLPDAGIPSNGVNCEHTLPQSFLKKFPGFESSKTDLYHLYPVESKVNSRRGNKPFAECDNEDVENIIFCGQNVEPPVEHKGYVARSLIYMSIRYNIPLNSTEEFAIRKWNAEYPPTTAEIERANRVKQVQGNVNPFIDCPDLVDLIEDL